MEGITYEQTTYRLEDVMNRYGVKRGRAYKIMREAKFAACGHYDGKLGKGLVHWTELKIWDEQLGIAGMAGRGRR